MALSYSYLWEISEVLETLDLKRIIKIMENNNELKQTVSWGGRTCFWYKGSVEEGTTIFYGTKLTKRFITKEVYSEIREKFRRVYCNIGSSQQDPPKNSVGHYLKDKHNISGMAGYIGAILVTEGYAEKNQSYIKIYK